MSCLIWVLSCVLAVWVVIGISY